MNFSLRNIYIYLVSFVSLMILIVSAVSLINTSLKYFVFTDAGRYVYTDYGDPMNSEETLEERNAKLAISQEKEDENHRNRQQESFINNISALLVAAPIYLYHWKTINKS